MFGASVYKLNSQSSHTMYYGNVTDVTHVLNNYFDVSCTCILFRPRLCGAIHCSDHFVMLCFVEIKFRSEFRTVE